MRNYRKCVYQTSTLIAGATKCPCKWHQWLPERNGSTAGLDADHPWHGGNMPRALRPLGPAPNKSRYAVRSRWTRRANGQSARGGTLGHFPDQGRLEQGHRRYCAGLLTQPRRWPQAAVLCWAIAWDSYIRSGISAPSSAQSWQGYLSGANGPPSA